MYNIKYQNNSLYDWGPTNAGWLDDGTWRNYNLCPVLEDNNNTKPIHNSVRRLECYTCGENFCSKYSITIHNFDEWNLSNEDNAYGDITTPFNGITIGNDSIHIVDDI